MRAMALLMVMVLLMLFWFLLYSNTGRQQRSFPISIISTVDVFFFFPPASLFNLFFALTLKLTKLLAIKLYLNQFYSKKIILKIINLCRALMILINIKTTFFFFKLFCSSFILITWIPLICQAIHSQLNFKCTCAYTRIPMYAYTR